MKLKAGVVTADGLWSAGLVLLVGQIAEVVMPDHNADVVLWALSLPDTVSDRRILAFGDDEEYLEALKRRRIGGIIVPQATVEELAMALRAVARGEWFLHPSLVEQFLEPEPEPERPYIEIPSPREIDILRYVAEGYTNRQAANVLGISVRTVESHRANLMDKVGLRCRRELVRYAKENGYCT